VTREVEESGPPDLPIPREAVIRAAAQPERRPEARSTQTPAAETPAPAADPARTPPQVETAPEPTPEPSTPTEEAERSTATDLAPGAVTEVAQEEPATTDGCLMFQSTPPGATVWLDDVQLSGSARSRQSAGPLIVQVPKGVHSVAMGSQGKVDARLAGVRIEPGARGVVHCDIFSGECSSTAEGSCP